MRSKLHATAVPALAAMVLVSLAAVTASAQNEGTTFTDAATPLAQAKGAHPLSSFGGSDFDRVNLFGGNVSMTFPLASLDGRAGLGVTVTLAYNSKTWRNHRLPTQPVATDLPITSDWESAELPLAPGWRISAGRMTVRKWGWGQVGGIQGCKGYTYSMTTVSFIAPDGTEYTFYDTATGGYRAYHASPACGNYTSRGTVFVTRDGTAATFISDSAITDNPDFAEPDGGSWQEDATGWVILRDGTRFRVVGGLVKRQQDRNGNFVEFEYDTSGRLVTVTDTLGRQITIEYFDTSKWATALAEVRVKGADGTERLTRILRTTLTDQLGTPPLYEDLFPSLDETGTWDPDLVGGIRLPSGHEWVFGYNEYGEVVRVETPAGGAVEYVHGWTSLENDGTPNDFPSYATRNGPLIFRRVHERRTFPDKTNSTPEGLTVYGDPTLDADVPAPTDQTVVTERFWDPASYPSGEPLAMTRHYFYGNPLDSYRDSTPDDEVRPWKEGKEFKTERGYMGSGGSFQARTREETDWDQGGTLSWCTGDACPEIDPLADYKLMTILETAQPVVSKVDYEYDGYNNVTSEKTYDYGTPGSGNPGTLLREVVREYLTSHKGVTFPQLCARGPLLH